MVRIIQITTKLKLSCIKKYIDWFTETLKSGKLDIEILFKEYQNIETKKFNSENFQQIITKNLSFYNNDNEMIDPVFKNVLEGHTDSVKSVRVTSDSKYAISGSKDKTIRIWNLSQKI